MSHTEPLLLVGPTREYRPGDFITVDGGPAVIRKVLSDTGTVQAEVEVYASLEERAKANAPQYPEGTLAKASRRFNGALRQLGSEIAKVLLCPIGIHEFRAAHPHYCARCGRHYGLRK